jgi:hypothetical protein
VTFDRCTVAQMAVYEDDVMRIDLRRLVPGPLACETSVTGPAHPLLSAIKPFPAYNTPGAGILAEAG